MAYFIQEFMKPDDPLPAAGAVSAVFLVAFKKDHILIIENDRGWEVPGGHLEEGEEIMDGLRREVYEEAGAEFEDAVPFLMLHNPPEEKDYAGKRMMFFATDHFELGEFEPSEDALGRELVTPEEFLERYGSEYIDNDEMGLIVDAARAALAKRI